MLPLSPASQPTVASSGNRSTCGVRFPVLLPVALKPNQPEPHELSHVVGEPLRPRPNRQTTRLRQASSLVAPAGWVLASMMLEAAPTPLQPDRLPHQQYFLVGRLRADGGGAGARNRTGRGSSRGASRVDDDQVARLGRVNRSLDRARSGDVRRSFSADGDRHGVDRLLTRGGRDDQLTAMSVRASVLRLLLNWAGKVRI